MRDIGVEHDFRDTVKEPLSAAELRALLGDHPLFDFLNPRSTPFRKRGLKDRKISRTEAVRLIREDVNFLKRPIVEFGGQYVSGLDEEAYRALRDRAL